MQSFKTRFDKGLYQLDDTIEAPKDTLRKASGARYLRDTGYLTSALGRRFLGSYWPPTGQGSHRRDIPPGFSGISSVGSLAWIQGSTADGSHPELEQIAWVERATLKTIPARPAVDDPAMDGGNARTVGSVAGVGNGPMQVVKLGATGQLAVTCGGQPQIVKRIPTGATVRPLGLPYQTHAPLVVEGFYSGALKPNAIHTFWFTQFDPTTGFESAALLPACSHIQIVNNTGDIEILVPDSTGDVDDPLFNIFNSNWTLRLYVAVTAYDGATALVVDSTYTMDGTAVHTRTLANAVGKLGWPVGGRLIEMTGNQLLANPRTIVHGTTGPKPYFELTHLVSNTTELALTPLYNFITISEDGENSDDALDGPPPSCTTMDEFQGSLCTNDVSDPRKGSYSVPGKYQSFPRGSYFINFNDDIVAIVTLDKKQGWLCRHSTYAVNWLPRQSDSDFSRGTIKELLSPTRGCVNVAAQTKVTWPGYGPACVWVSDDGIYISDWVRTPERITPQIDWPLGGVPEQMKLVDDPDRSRLELYVPRGETVDQYYLYYDVPHLHGIIPSIVGPNPRTAVAAATQVLVAGGSRRIVTADKVGSLFYEDIGHQDVSMVTQGDLTTGLILLNAESHFIYPITVGTEMEVKRVMGVARNQGDLSLDVYFGKDGFFETGRRDHLTPDVEPILIRTVNRRCEYVRFVVQGSNDAMVSEVGFLYDMPAEARR